LKYVSPLPSDDKRLQRRYLHLVQEHLSPVQAVAAGLRALPGTAQAFASTQAAWRFYANPRVTLPQLVQPLIEAARTAVAHDNRHYALVVHDWSQLLFSDHASKRDRAVLSSSTDLGYELLTALVLSDRDGAPIAPVCQQLRAAKGVYSSRSTRVQPVPSQLDALAPTMRFVQRLKLGKPTVHIIDREADSVAHYRQWSRHQRLFVVRADAQRIVRHEGQERSLSEVVACLHRSGVFRRTRTVLYHGRRAEQFVAEAAVVLERPAAPNRRGAGGGPRRLVRGAKLPLRLVVSEVRDPDGTLLATWLLLTNVPATVSANEVALWYYWRWRVESYFKLLKGAGMHLERWQQETASAVAKRLLVASMACVVVWQLARSETEEAAEVRRLLVRLSGRQMKWGVEFTEPALLSGLWVLLALVRVLELHDLDDLLRLAQSVLPMSDPPDIPLQSAV
jgi:Transposase DDE domain